MEPNEIENETICAISTPQGVGGIAVARVSGSNAIAIVNSLWKGKSLDSVESHTAHLGTILDTRSEMLDQAVATVYRAPRSFTGDDVVEISVHGSRWIQRELIASLCKAGCRVAQPGEFTRRAFASGRLDLAEAEAVADMISANSRAAHRAAAYQMRGHYSAHIATMRDQLVELASLLELELDFSEEEVQFASRSQLLQLATQLKDSLVRLHDSYTSGAVIKDGIPVAILGKTNAGKSSLLNVITGDDRAIVSDIHGTTRDVVEDLVEIGDYLFRFQDTAGLRQTHDAIEQIGIQRSLQAAQRALIIIYIVDATDIHNDNLLTLSEIRDTNPDAHIIVALNKIDLLGADDTAIDTSLQEMERRAPATTVLPLSTKLTPTVDSLKATLRDIMHNSHASDEIIVTNARHAQALEQAVQSAQRIIDGLNADLSGDFIAQDVRETIHHLSTITGSITTDTLLSTIFSRFCIGK